MDRKNVGYKLILLFASGLFALVLGELTLRAVTTDSFYVWRPSLRRVFRPAPGLMPGIEGDSRFTINADGIRGDPLRDQYRYRILAVGASTTASSLLDDSEAWPYVAQELINARLGSKGCVWIGNVGKAGRNAAHHVVQVRELLAQYPQIDAVLLLVGVNDLSHRLKVEGEYQRAAAGPDSEAELYRQAFDVPGPYAVKFLQYENDRFYKRTEIWRRLRLLRRRLTEDQPSVDVAGKFYRRLRRERQEARALRDSLPELDLALEEYAQHLNRIVDITTGAGVRLIFLTQPFMWRSDLPDELERLLWFGGIGESDEDGPREYYSTGALAEGMRRYNETLLGVCDERDVECIDLASDLPQDTTVFYDDVHFNESGAVRVAEAVTGYLTSPALAELLPGCADRIAAATAVPPPGRLVAGAGEIEGTCSACERC